MTNRATINFEQNTGRSYPLGATYDGNGVNFAVYSENATEITLCLFESVKSESESHSFKLKDKTHNIWHTYIKNIKPYQLYGYRIDGQFAPEEGHRFNKQKLLIDPYAKAIGGRIESRDKMFDYNKDIPFEPDEEDNALIMNKSIVVDGFFDWEEVKKPNTPMNETIIYELHVRGYTMLHPLLKKEERGTYKGLANESIIQYFNDLGITAIELMPIHHFIHDKFLLEKGLTNYWGYNTIGFFAPHAEYASSGQYGQQVTEFKEMVKAFHKAGIEIILDVVYNHTGESDHLGPILNFKGIDNKNYYRLKENKKEHYFDFTGTGNTLDISNSYVLQLIMDSLRYWSEEMQVDGFRFDLCSSLLRGRSEVVDISPFLYAIQQDPVLSKQKLIAEPWDLGPDGYRVGKFPPYWSEWNGKYRDTMRKYWRGDENQILNFAKRFVGSPELYNSKGKSVSTSINFITCHDGFTLHDLVSYNKKHNTANKENSMDGENHNMSWNSGEEGETDRAEIKRLREKRKRTFIGTLLFSLGVPMISHGDEYGHSKMGNNNTYCQDNELSWMNWEWDEEQKDLYGFTKKCIEIRKSIPVFQNNRFLSWNEEVQFFNTNGNIMPEEEWYVDFIRCIGILISRENSNDRLFFISNSYWEPVKFMLPTEKLTGVERWGLVIDSSGNRDDTGKIELNNNTRILLPSRGFILLQNLYES